MVKILFVCLGNICRSPMAEFIFRNIIEKKGLERNFFIDSAATSDYNEKNKTSIYSEAKDILGKKNIPFTNRLSKQMKKEDYHKFDYIIGMEEENIGNILKIIETDTEKKVFKLLDFTENPRDIIDPWYSGDFNATYNDIKYGFEKLLEHILNKGL